MPRHIAYKLPLSSLDIVVVEDNQSMRQILHSMITAFGVSRLRVFSNGESALQEMPGDPPNLVISDWHMKPVNGYEMIRAMRHKDQPTLSLVPVIMLTGFASRSFVQKSFDAGVQQFLVKPVSPMALLKRIKWILMDDRELILQDEHYVRAESIKIASEKMIRNKAKVQILMARMMAEKGDSLKPAPAPEQFARAAGAETAGAEHEQWEI
ncbi:MAG TPA: response regulator [Rhizobiales bacterium]|nr:response regulator [Hyphomicrobiales bacterium]